MTRRYWLFKTEPSAFSLEDLRNRPDQTEPWDGVRNFQARNFLRDQVQVGDLVFFYHSNIPDPAIVGIAEVVRGGYPDRTAFDPASAHFDPRSTPERPVWYLVEVRFRRKLARPVRLAELKEVPALSDLPLLKRSRLSIQPVEARQWEIILALHAENRES